MCFSLYSYSEGLLHVVFPAAEWGARDGALFHIHRLLTLAKCWRLWRRPLGDLLTSTTTLVLAESSSHGNTAGFRFRTRYYWSLLRQNLVRTPQNPRFFLLVNVWMRAMLPAYLRLLLDLARVRSCCADILSLLSCIDQRQRRSIGRILVISFISGCCHMCRYRVCFGGDIEGFGHWELMSSLRNLTRNISIPGN